MGNKDDYWTQFWTQHGETHVDADPQQQVLRTLNRKPIESEKWEQTLDYIKSKLALTPKCKVLDLAGGNGLIGRGLAADCDHVVIVDISDKLLQNVPADFENITTVQGDMRTVEFAPNSFDRILCYAALQYLSWPESVQLFNRIHHWLKDDGILFLGDIPDLHLIWKFFDSDERKAAYFRHQLENRAIVGTWFDRQWLTHLAKATGFQRATTLDQPKDQIYSWFRFDMQCEK